MQAENDGLTLWYDTPDAPLGARSITVGVQPAHPANAVSVYYRSAKDQLGFLRSVPAVLVPALAKGHAQYFRAALPETAVEVLPVLSSAGRQVPASVSGASHLWQACPPLAAPPAPPVPAAPSPLRPRFRSELDFLGTVTALLQPPETIGVTPQGLRRNFYIISGSCVGPKLNATIRAVGADWMLIQRDGLALPNVRTTWETADGALLYGEYSGTFDLGEDGYENALRDRFPTLPVVQLAPRFVTAHPRWAWLNRLQCVGIGQVDMDRLEVSYDLYAVRGGQALRGPQGAHQEGTQPCR
jgi:hypothetical protein